MIKQINIALAIILVALIGVRIYVMDSVSTAGKELAELNVELSSLKQENEQLRVELLSLNSLTRVETRAHELGYSNNTFEFLESPDLALR